jgi:NAD(P)H-nitrite reductase large subunit
MDLVLASLTSSSTDDTQVCSCHNVAKGDIVETIKSGRCKTLDDVKSCTKAGTGCGGCVPLVTSIVNRALEASGQKVTNHSKTPKSPLLWSITGLVD